MKKTSIISKIIIVILTLALIAMIIMYFNMRNNAKQNYEDVLDNAEQVAEANEKISELESELEVYKNADVFSTTTNTLNTNDVSSEPYVPEGMEVAEPDDNYGIESYVIEFDRSTELVKIEVQEDSITSTSVVILITDDNKFSYGWGRAYRIQVKENGEWNEVEPISDLVFEEIAYGLNKNNQFTQKINWKKFYGELESGTYRIAKPVYDSEYIDLYSNEFEIK